MKKICCIVLSILLIASLLTACGGQNPPTPTDAPQPTETAERHSIVTTIFPEYDWVRELLGEKAADYDLTLLLDTGKDLHNYEPSAEDIVTISDCDLFIYVGGESDDWVEDVLAQAGHEGLTVINLLEVLGDRVKAEEVKEGMEAEHDHAHKEIEAEDIQDRSLEEFTGEWKSLYPMLQSGLLDAYVDHEAEEDGSTTEEAFTEISANWSSDVTAVSINGQEITFTYADGKTATAIYTYAGYSTVPAEDGDIAGVRYQFETDSADAPKYIQLSDHGFAPADEVEHFHLYFGNDGFEALTASESNPFFVPAEAPAEDVLDELTGEHGHHHEEGEEESDEHVWLSLKNAALLCENIAEKLGETAPEDKAVIDANAAAYIRKLNALDAEYQAAADAATVRTLLFGDRFPFRYLVDDYGLDYYAAFVGCSAESEASFETIAFLAEKVDELGLKAIMQIESADGSIAQTIRATTQTKDQTIYTLDSLQSTTAKDITDGKTYLGAMENNLTVLNQALH